MTRFCLIWIALNLPVGDATLSTDYGQCEYIHEIRCEYATCAMLVTARGSDE